MSERDGSQHRTYHDRQFHSTNVPAATQAFEEQTGPIPVRTSTPPPPHIKWPIIYSEQEELVTPFTMPSPPPGTPPPTEPERQRRKKLLDYALATAFPSNQSTIPTFPQLPNTPIPAPGLTELETTPPPMTVTSSLEEMQQQTALSQSESSSRLRAIRLARMKES